MSNSNAVKVVYDNIDKIARQLPAATSRIVGKTAHAIVGEIKMSMQEPKSGNAYGAHVASAPGEAPAVDMGALINSLEVYFVQGQPTAAVYTIMDYGPHLEFGAPAAGIAARPFMAPGAAKVEPWFIGQMKDLERQLK